MPYVRSMHPLAGNWLSLVTIPFRLIEPHAVVVPVWVNGSGPFQFAVDTGAQSSSLQPGIARRLGLTATYAVEVVRVQEVSVAPVHFAALRFGSRQVGDAELLGISPPLEGLDGILGQNVLGAGPVLLDNVARRLVLDPPEIAAPAVPMELIANRPAVTVNTGGQRLRMVLDSGASHVVLFHGRAGPRRLAVGGVELRGVESVRLSVQREEDGLLPTRLFGAVRIDPARRVVQFTRATPQ